MTPAERLGRAARGIGVLVGIRHVREEQAVRLNHHGGDFAELNEKFSAFADRMESRMANLEREVLG